MGKSLTIQKEKITKQRPKKKKKRFIQLFIPHCTALCQSKVGGVISLKQGESPLVGKIWNPKVISGRLGCGPKFLHKNWLFEEFSWELLAEASPHP